MKRIPFGVLAVLLAMGGCPSQKSDPLPGVVTVLTAGNYSGTLNCTTVDGDGVQLRQSTTPGKVLVTAAGGLRVFDSNIAPDANLDETQKDFSTIEHVDSVTESGSTVTVQTSGSITSGGETLTSARQVTVTQADPRTINLVNTTQLHSDTVNKTLTTTCSGDVTQ